MTMSTRCWIGQKTKEGIKAFYCHHDGYITKPGMGYALPTFYNTEDKVTELINTCYQTGTSSVEDTIEKTKKELYDDDFPLPIFKDKDDYVSNIQFDIEYLYLFDKGKWEVFIPDMDKWKILE